MAFKINKSAAGSMDSPEAMFRDIKTKKIKGPLADQADLWRAYQEGALDKTDVALQLPTGGGKTLVGLVLSEWRRQKFNERVLMLCPTRQLVNQVVVQSQDQYGIRVSGFTGSKANYDREASARYQNCERIGITTYSSLFNVAPYFEDPHILVLDDAHAAEQYIASMWSLNVNRSNNEHAGLYDAITASLKAIVPAAEHLRLAQPERWFSDKQWIEKLPSPTFLELCAELVPIVDAHYQNSIDHRFVWPTIREHIAACHLYMSAGAYLIRPLLPPTYAHKPFSEAKQRIYMSATLGEAGELERITGRREISRIKGKASWDRQTIGRRYFMFPERSLDESRQMPICLALIKYAGRALALSPDNRRAEAFREAVTTQLQFPVLTAQDIESTKAAFIEKENAVAVVANRYDGIDFPEAECRLLIIEGLPRATNLQEQFLIARMGAIDMLNVRITTRLVQAFGRCTRSDQDYSAVVIRGEELNKYLMTPERRAALQPELQAELVFGIDQAKGASEGDYTENLAIFLAQGDEWRAANDDILSRRDLINRAELPGASNLAAAAIDELGYTTAIWEGDGEAAFEAARAVLTKLTAPELRGYRALWHYLAGSAAWQAYRAGREGFDTLARTQFESALKCERAIHWLFALRRLSGVRLSDTTVSKTDSYDPSTLACVERIEGTFDRLGTLHDFKFNTFEAEVRKRLSQNDAREFEAGHEKLGELLGYESGNSNESGAPDPWWIGDTSLCFVFEDNSDAQPNSTLSVTKARQVCTHPNWVRNNLPVTKDTEIVAVLVTPLAKVDPAAAVHLNDVLVWSLQEFRAWSTQALEVIRDLRRIYPGSGDLAWRAVAAQRLTTAKVAPRSLLAMLRERTRERPRSVN